jgi:hypothetical protein
LSQQPTEQVLPLLDGTDKRMLRHLPEPERRGLPLGQEAGCASRRAEPTVQGNRISDCGMILL